MADPAPNPAPVADQPRPGTTDPRRSRVRALKVLFQADLKGEDPSATLADIAIDPNAVALLDDLDLDDDKVKPTGDAGLDDYARVLVDGVAARRHRLDGIIGRFSHRWEVNRMPVVDRNILRLGVWELLFQQVSPAVVIDEAVELAKDLSGDASHRFINGILEAVRKEADTLRADLAQPDPDNLADADAVDSAPPEADDVDSAQPEPDDVDSAQPEPDDVDSVQPEPDESVIDEVVAAEESDDDVAQDVVAEVTDGDDVPVPAEQSDDDADVVATDPAADHRPPDGPTDPAAGDGQYKPVETGDATQPSLFTPGDDSPEDFAG